ncbi:MAG: hypothetical protein IPP68_11195 [Elusimicrobia bacterium]|nr:hypothetical protein [Elusimicrobiota bacterium]
MKTNNVAAALQEDGIALRQRLLRLLYCFEALKHLPNEELYHGEERSIADRLREKVRSFDDRALAIDAFESYVQRVVRSPKPITVPVFLDDNGEVVFVLRFILDQMAMNKNLRFVLVPRNGQYREDASVDDVKRILNSPLFKKEVQSLGDRLRVVPGCAGDGVDVRKFSRELVDVLLSADVVLSIGQMNFEGLNTFKKDLYFFFVSTHPGNSVVTGVPTGRGIFAYLPAGTKAFSTYADRLFRRLRFGSGVTIPVAGHTLLEAAAISPENKINEPFEVLNDSPKGQGPGGAPKPGRATSRWMTAFFESVGGWRGGVEGSRQTGAHYKAHAPVYEWGLGLGTALANIGAAVFFAGTAWAVVPLLLTALFLPSHALPARWLHTEVQVDWAKAGIMALFYFALVAAAPLLALDAGWPQTVLQAAGWGLTLLLHRRLDSKVDKGPPSPISEVAMEQTLTAEQRRFAARVTEIVGAKPARLGVEDYMYGAARAAVRTAAVSGRPAPSLEDLKGTPVLFVDARSVATEKQRTALEAFLKGKPNAVIFTDADDLLIAGADIRVRRGVFSSLRTPEGDLPSGVVEVALAGLGTELGSLARGGGLQLFQTAALKLNARGADEPVAEAANRAWILSDLFTLLSPALAPEKWDDVLKVLTAIARSA